MHAPPSILDFTEAVAPVAVLQVPIVALFNALFAPVAAGGLR